VASLSNFWGVLIRSGRSAPETELWLHNGTARDTPSSGPNKLIDLPQPQATSHLHSSSIQDYYQICETNPITGVEGP
jgi:hypothetical protein